MLPVAGILDPLTDALEAVILFLHDDLGFGWGMAIIGLTFIVRAAVLPLSLKGIRSMRRMQVLAPHLQAVRDKYKDDPQRFQRETMKVYQEHGVNPFSSCFPFLLQIPFFIGLYQLLRSASFKADVLADKPDGWLFIESLVRNPEGGEMIALILLFIGTTIPTFLLTTTTTTVNPSQRYIFMALPVLISPFIISLPAGLAVYWIATNVWSLGQQAVVQRLIPAPPQPTVEEVKAAKPPPPPPRKRKRRR